MSDRYFGLSSADIEDNLLDYFNEGILEVGYHVDKHGQVYQTIKFDSDDGYLLKINKEQTKMLREYIRKFPVWKTLAVFNRTYEISSSRPNAIDYDVAEIGSDEICMIEEEAFSNRANRFFNTKVHVSNGSDRVLSMLLTEFSLDDLKGLVKHKSLGGMPPDLNEKILNRFANQHGKTPDIITLAIPINRSNVHGLMSNPVELTKVGERL